MNAGHCTKLPTGKREPRFFAPPTRHVFLALWLMTMFLVASEAAADDFLSAPFPGVQRIHRLTSSQNINILIVDLCHPGVAIRATAYSERGRTTQDWASTVGLQAAVNEDFCVWPDYCGRIDYSPEGLAMSSAELWPGSGDTPFEGFLAAGFGRVMLSPNGDLVSTPEPWMREIVGGRPTILEGGVPRESWPENDSLQALCTEINPRTGVGLSADRRTLTMVVVDGRTPGRTGMTCRQLADIFLEFGASDALNLDGGGSSTMWLQHQGVVNYPSDGSPRTLTNHLGVYATGSGYEWSQCPFYAAQFVDQSFPYAHLEALHMVVGERVDGWIEMRNIGRETWEPDVTKMAPTPRDTSSPFHAATWLSSIRISTVPTSVPPQSTVRFPVRLRASEPGDFHQTFGLVQEGVTWFADPPLGGGPSDDFLAVHVVVAPAPDTAEDAVVDDPAADETAADLPETSEADLPEATEEGVDGGDVPLDSHVRDTEYDDAQETVEDAPADDEFNAGCSCAFSR